MAFVKKTWKDRISDYPNRRVIDDGITSKVVTVSRSEGSVTEEGDAFNASNMNDLEQRIFNATRGGGGGGGASELSELDDVNISSPTNGQILKYNGTSEKWENTAESAPWTDLTGTLTSGSTSITLSDASITTTSTIEVFDDLDVPYNSKTLINGSVTLTFDAQESDMVVKVRVS